MEIKIILCIISIILILGCTTQIQEQNTETTPAEEEIVTSTPAEEPVIEQPTATIELLSEVRCTEERIVGVLTNTFDQTIEVQKDIQLHINGLINRELGCEKTTLEPGESTFCETLNGRYPVRSPGNNRLTAVLDGSSYDEVITC